jgi:hypothetical protein
LVKILSKTLIGKLKYAKKEKTKRQWSRKEVAEKTAEFEEKYPDKPSQRQLAEELGIPRSTLQHWLVRKENIDADPELVAFFETPAGVAFLHRLILAAHFVMTLLGPCGVRLVCLFLELSGLDRFVAASYTPQWKVSVAMAEAIGEFEQAEKERLGQEMAPKQITVCEDETFHPETCLVAIEPVSNFILLEKYTADRKADTWTKALDEATSGLPIAVIQSTSDEGRSILRHVKEDLGVHHSPDVFHVQNELVKATSCRRATGLQIERNRTLHRPRCGRCPESANGSLPGAELYSAAQAPARRCAPVWPTSIW